jgi:hypothetical protein
VKEESSFCEQKEAKKLFIRFGDSAFSTPSPFQVNEVFCALFFKKALLT